MQAAMIGKIFVFLNRSDRYADKNLNKIATDEELLVSHEKKAERAYFLKAIRR